MSVTSSSPPPLLLFPRCAAHPGELAGAACDRCGVFYCARCVVPFPPAPRRLLCPACRRRPFDLDRDLVMEGHLVAISRFNVAMGIFAAVMLVALYLRSDLLAGHAARPALLAGALLVCGVVPLWLAANLSRGWPAGRSFQLLYSMALVMAGGLALAWAPATALRIQGFLLADYNVCILYVLVSKGGSACFGTRYAELRRTLPGEPRASSLYVLFAFWMILTLFMLTDFVKVS